MAINYLLFFYEPNQVGIKIPFTDKIVHFFLFSSLSSSFFWGIVKSKFTYNNLMVVLALLILITYAGVTELIQHYFVLGRTGEWQDFAADCFGIIIGLSLLKPIYKN